MSKIYELKVLKSTFGLFKKNIKFAFVPMIIDLVGLFFFLIIHGFFYTKIIEYLSLILLRLAEDSNSFFSILLFQKDLGVLLENYPEIGIAIKSLIILTFLMISILYLVYSIFSGFSLAYCGRFVGVKKLKLEHFFKRYLKINLLWVFFLALGWIMSILIELNVVVMQRIDSSYTGGLLSGFVTFFFFLVMYLIWISYGLIFKHGFIDMIKKIFKIKFLMHLRLILVFLVLVFIVLLIDYIIGFFNSLILIFIFGLIVFFPLFVYIRIYIINYFQFNRDY